MAQSILDTLFNPLLKIDPLLGVLIISVVISLLITVAYKFLTDQKKMKRLKDDIQEGQKNMKKFKDNPKKLMEIQKKAMESNMEYMTHSFRPTLFTLIPIFILFGWLNAHMTYHQLQPNVPFTVQANFDKPTSSVAELVVPSGLTIIGESATTIKDNSAKWTLKGDAGLYYYDIKYNGQSYNQSVLLTNEREYIPPQKDFKKSELKSIINGNERIHPLPFSIFGWEPGWLGAYVIFSLIISTLLRKLLKVY
jgi:uncharacterized membrane protein (DUF106 family)